MSDVKNVSSMLPEKPFGVGRPITDRDAWKRLGENEAFKKVVSEAEKEIDKPIPELTDENYLDYSKTGNRSRCEAIISKRRGRVRLFVLAECLENKGRFIKPLEKTIEALCQEKAWVFPAHDIALKNFNGELTDIDLASSALGFELATADHLLGDKLDPKIRKLVRENLNRRILAPFIELLDGKQKNGSKAFWFEGEVVNNWNPVCLAGIVGTALTIVESRDERARYVQAAQERTKRYLRSFGSDGYCSEGVGYWNYGFGHYVLLSDIIIQATGGKIDLLKGEDVKRDALFGVSMEIMNEVYPSIADCTVGSKPDRNVVSYLNRRYKLGLDGYEGVKPTAGGRLFESMIYSLPYSGKVEEQAVKLEPLGPRTWFDASGLLICRPGSQTNCIMGVALKGGHNDEEHNHNDVGTYVVAVGKSTVLYDPGPEVYTARTFSNKRYDSRLINSYGHPVPVVAGQLQRTGKEARGVVLSTDFTDKADTLSLDISSAYAVTDLTKLVRTFVFSRTGKGSLKVTDDVEFKKPESFGSAMITYGECKIVSSNKVSITDGADGVVADIAVEGAEFDVTVDEIKEDSRLKKQPLHIGINLKKPVTKAKIRLTITPAGN